VTAKVRKRVKRVLTGAEALLHWRIAIRAGGQYILSSDGQANTNGFHWIESPKGHFYADPFIVDRDGQHWLFFEDYNYLLKRGCIACAPVSPDGRMGEVQKVLDPPFHLSFPHIFSDGDCLYMIPESGAQK